VAIGGFPVAASVYRQASHEALPNADANRRRFSRHQKPPLRLRCCNANRIGQQRRTNLLLAAALAAFLLWCIGVAGENQPLSKQVRVNSSSKRDPYSAVFLARLLLRQPTFRLSNGQLWQSLTTIKPYVESVLCA